MHMRLSLESYPGILPSTLGVVQTLSPAPREFHSGVLPSLMVS